LAREANEEAEGGNDAHNVAHRRQAGVKENEAKRKKGMMAHGKQSDNDFK
jgi:hypothetical protein